MKSGTILKSTGSWYQVLLDDGNVHPCRTVGKMRIGDQRYTNPIAVGDRVQVQLDVDAEDTGSIVEVLPRRNFVVRQSPRKKHEIHVLAANIDQALLVTTVVQPSLKPGFIDRFLLMVEPFQIPTILVFNKVDLYDEEDLSITAALHSLYRQLGYTTLSVSATDGEGIAELRTLLKDKTTMIGGQSGVGKSTLANALDPDLELRTAEISDYSGKGQHTTTFAEMHSLPFGGMLIDTPGIKTLSFNYFEPDEVAHNFRELFGLSPDCRFGGRCLHRSEPGCAVKAALEQGTITELRYNNYLTILGEIEEQNYWERKKT